MMNPEKQYQNGQPGVAPAGGQPTYAPASQPQQPPMPEQTTQPGAYGSIPAGPNPTAAVPSNPSDRYDFIFAEKPVEKKAAFGGSSLMQRVLLIVGGLVALTIAAVLVTSLFSSREDINSRLFAVTQEQQEIIRIAAAGSTKAIGNDARNLALNTQLSLTTSQQAAFAYMKERNGKVDEKLLGAKANAETDKLLEAALTNNTYDTTLVQTLHGQLVTYRTNLNTTYQEVSGENARALLAESYKAADLLIAQANKITASQTP